MSAMMTRWIGLVVLAMLAASPLVSRAQQQAAPQPEGPPAEDAERENPAEQRGETAGTPLVTGDREESEEVEQLLERYRTAPVRAAEAEDAEPPSPTDTFAWRLQDQPEETTDRRRIQLLTFPSAVAYGPEPNRTVPVRVARPPVSDADETDDADATPDRLPAIIVVHHIGSNRSSENFLLNYFSARGYVVAMPYLPHYGPRRASDNDPSLLGSLVRDDHTPFAQAVWDIHRLRDWMRDQPDIDPERVSILGTSLGGILASLAAGVDPGFDQHIFALAGGDLARMVFNGHRVVRGMLEYVQNRGMDEEELRNRCRPIDPVTFAHRIDASTVLMANMEEDDVIPRACTDALVERLDTGNGERQQIWYPGIHLEFAARIFPFVAAAQQYLEAEPGADADEGAEPEESGGSEGDEADDGESTPDRRPGGWFRPHGESGGE